MKRLSKSKLTMLFLVLTLLIAAVGWNAVTAEGGVTNQSNLAGKYVLENNPRVTEKRDNGQKKLLQ